MTPDISRHDMKTDLTALDALFGRIGEGINVTHSAGGFPGWLAAIENPNIRGIVSYEPGTYVFPEGEVPEPMPGLTGTLKGVSVPMDDFMKLTKIPIVLYFGDYIPEEVTDKLGGENWRVRLQMGRKFVEAINRHGGNATLVELPKMGIRGNTHFMMSGLNNIEIADLLTEWLHHNKLNKQYIIQRMRKLLLIPFLCFSLTIGAACSKYDDNSVSGTEQRGSPDQLSGNSKILVAYFSATGNTQAVAERIVELLGTDVYRIRASVPYASNPYDDSDRVQNEAYNDLRPGVANLPAAETIAQYDTIFVGSPCWWHQPAMVVCTFLDNYDLSGKTIIPFITYGATTYLNESMQKIYKLTPNSKHIPVTLPEDLDPDDITTPGRPDDDGIDMPGRASGVEAWLRRMGVTIE